MAAAAVPASFLRERPLAGGFQLQRSTSRPAQQVSFRRAPARRPLVAGIPTSTRHVEKLKVAIIFSGDKGSFQALELTKYLNELPGVEVKVGWIGDTRSLSIGTVSAEEDDTQGVMREIVPASDVVCLFLPDMTLASIYKNIFSFMKPNARLAISDGFPPGQQPLFDVDNNKNISTLLANPEEIGTYIRDLNIQKINGAGTNSSLPIHQEEEGLPTFRMGKLHRTRKRNLGLLITGAVAGALLTWVMMGQVVISVLPDKAGGLLSMVGNSSKKNHWIEVLNESLIEAVSSLNPLVQAGGLLSMIGSFSTLFQEISPFAILLWVATLWLWYKEGGNLLKCSGILLCVFSAVVVAVSIAASFTKFEPTGAGFSTLPCDGARNWSCDPACGMSSNYLITINGHQNNVNIYRP